MLGRGKESWWCFCSVSEAPCPVWRIRADVENDKQSVDQLISGICAKELRHPFIKHLSNLLLMHFSKGIRCQYLNTINVTYKQTRGSR